MKPPAVKHGILYLVCGIPVAALLMGMVSLYVAFSLPDQSIPAEQRVLSKTSWQATE